MPTRAARALFALAFAAGCAAAPHRQRAEVPPAGGPAPEDLGPAEIELAEHEAEVIAVLARGDPSIAARFELKPSLADAGDEPHELGGAGGDAHGASSNWFSARERARGLDDAERALAQWPIPARIMHGVSTRAHELLLERELVARMLREERFRYEHERQLPRGASDLVRAAVAAYRAVPAGDPQRQHEWWIVRRLEEIRASLRNAPLPALEADELDDALDPLEKLGLPGVDATLAALRVELGDRKVQAPRPANGAELERLLAAHLGTIAPLAVTRSRLERAEAALKDEVHAQAARMGAETVRRAEQDAEPLLFGAAPCGHPESKMRRALPPPERAPACAALASVLAAKDERAALAATIALHDHAAAALWAIAVRADGLNASAAQAKTRLLSATPPDRAVRLLRLAVVHAALAVGAGLGAEVLIRRGPAGVSAVARAWSDFGDAPFDVIDRLVVARVP